MRSRLGVNGMPPLIGTRPYVARMPTIPQRSAGSRMDPRLSVPMEKAHRPAAVADAGPALDPPEGSSRFQGLRHLPPNQSQPSAISPVAALPRRTAPASRNLRTIVASSAGMRFRYKAQPQVVGIAAVSNTSLME